MPACVCVLIPQRAMGALGSADAVRLAPILERRAVGRQFLRVIEHLSNLSFLEHQSGGRVG